jgi:hypothetical protein
MFTTPSGQLGLLEDLGQHQRRERRGLGRLETQVFPAANAGASFQAAISSGKFHGMICPATPSGAGGAESGVVELVGPAGVVEEVRRGQGYVDVAGFADGLAVVHRLDDGQLARALLDQPGDAKEVLRALRPGVLDQTPS